MSFTLKQIRYFVSIAEQGSVSLAARSLFISQPALSSAVGQLEQSLGLQLFIRHHARGVSVTPAGQLFLGPARGLLAQVDELESLGLELGDAVHGELKVGCFVTLAPFFIPRLLTGLQQKYPHLKVKLSEGALDQLQQALLSGEIELALLYAIDLDDRLASEELARVLPHALVPSSHPLADRSSVSLREFGAEPMILLDLPHSRDYFRSLFLDAGVEPAVRHRTRSFELVRGLVARGHGYSVLNLQPHSNHTYDGGKVHCIPIVEPTTDLIIAVARTRSIRPTRRAEAFTAYCRKFFSTG